ncbi:MAG TPA: hypothetical protein VGA73_06765 [Candidatus Binatia bacterium]
MELRDHPLMAYRGQHSWPPVWAWVGGNRDQQLTGEIGVLKEVRFNEDERRTYLLIEHERALYMGCLLISDAAFARQIVKLLEASRGRSIEEIGGLDAGFAL